MTGNEISKFIQEQSKLNRKIIDSIQKLNERWSQAQSLFVGFIFGLLSTLLFIKNIHNFLKFFQYLGYLYNNMTPDGKFNTIVIVPVTIIFTLLLEVLIKKIRKA